MFKQSLNLTVKSAIKDLERVREFISSLGAKLGFDEHSVFEMEISVYEACANIIEHAYKNAPNNEIEITVTWDTAKAVITIIDTGSRLPENIERYVDITKFIESRQNGGLGIYIMEACMDKIEYRRENDTNVLELVKFRRAE